MLLRAESTGHGVRGQRGQLRLPVHGQQQGVLWREQRAECLRDGELDFRLLVEGVYDMT